MSCRHVEPLLSRHLEGHLPEREATAVVAHLADCPACRRFRADLAALGADMRDLPEPLSSPDLPRRAVDRWMAEAAGRKATPIMCSRRLLAWGIGGAAVAAALLALIGLRLQPHAGRGKKMAVVALPNGSRRGRPRHEPRI